MEDNIAPKKQPNLPSNYVTLAQLQERWIKKQQMKQKEKEQQVEPNQKKLHNQEAEAEHLSQPIRRNFNWKSYHRNLIGTNVEESKAVSVAVLEENEKSKELNRKGRNKKKNKGEARAQEEGKVAGSGAHALLVKSEKKNFVYERQREMRVEYRAKVEKVVEENNQTVEIEKEIGNLSIVKESEKSNRQNKVSNGRMRNREYRNYYGYANRGDRNHRGYNDSGDRDNGRYREGYGRFNSENGQYGGGHGRFNGDGQRKWTDNGKVWVKKEEVADGGHVVGNQSSSGSFE